MTTRRGLLFAFEGIDGAGKTTQALALRELLSQVGVDAIYSKEPTHGKWGEKIRASFHAGRLPPAEELACFIEDRKEHVRDVVEPALAAGKVVILDRYYVSSAAYQGARGLDADEILCVNESFAPRPNRVFVLRISPETALRRIGARAQGTNVFEREESLRATSSVFDALHRDYFDEIDGELSRDDVLTVVWRAVEAAVSIWRRGASNVAAAIAAIAHDAKLSDAEKVRRAEELLRG